MTGMNEARNSGTGCTGPMMEGGYINLRAEMARIGYTRKELARRTGIKYPKLLSKMQNKTDFYFDEAARIAKELGNLSLDYVFAWKE